MGNFNHKFSSNNQEWETPVDLFNPLNDEFHFTLDVCANQSNSKCQRFFSVQDNAFLQNWNGVCWMNPPFKELGKWVEKAYKESQQSTVVCLIPCRTNTVWWHQYVMKGEIRFILGRPKFNGAKHGLPQPLAIVIFRPSKNQKQQTPQ